MSNMLEKTFKNEELGTELNHLLIVNKIFGF